MSSQGKSDVKSSAIFLLWRKGEISTLENALLRSIHGVGGGSEDE